MRGVEMKTIVTIIALQLFTLTAFAGVKAYTGQAGEKLYIESAPKLGKKITHLVKFEGTDSSWDGKVIAVEKDNKDRYSFEYDLELSNGTHKRTYTIIVPAGSDLVNGSRVDRIELHTQDFKGKPVFFNYSADLTNSSQKVGLGDEHKKSPFKPEVD
jgi:hypothetical protein